MVVVLVVVAMQGAEHASKTFEKSLIFPETLSATINMAAKRECRLRLRKSEPVSYYMHTCTTFLDLPRELRDRIYSTALISPNPITVCSMTVDSHENNTLMDPDWFKDDEGRIIHDDKYIIASKAAILEELAFGLLQASKTIASEAAVVLYRSNTFHFGGSQVWNPFYGWLDLIGEENCSYLQKISLELVKPEYLNSNALGIRTFGRRHDFRRQKVVYCSQPTEADALDFVDPAIEACFRILGMHGPRLQLTLLLAPPFLPGVNVWVANPQTYEPELWPWYSLDIPKSVERSRAEFSSGVDVLWFGKGRKDMFFKQAEEIREKGWEVLETKDVHHVSPLFDYWETYFVLQRSCSSTLGNPRSWSMEGTFEQYKLIKWR
ncbi:hypothetical protein OIDMADRAFT_149516 [Oidiodendron maius Zn]|uniref:F-box domain-containing protein n=1 Tax=Oidiodendron maius (strain Zn) TaxID=913774 RepID=A0A0C3CWH1_OIDMZ|nr:hypothetical protein OIDMADRAFT_149516 [Oidiodendron maius Zn]